MADSSALLSCSRDEKKRQYTTFPKGDFKLPAVGDIPWLSRFTYTHARPLLDEGSSRRLELEDLWQLPDEHHAGGVFAAFKCVYEDKNGDLLSALFSSVGWKYLLCGVGNGIRAACTIFAPIVLRHVVDTFSGENINKLDMLLWVSAFFASRLVNAVLEAHVNFHVEMTLMKLSVSLKALVLEKLMRCSIQSKRTNENRAEVSNVVTADIDNLMWSGYQINSVWILPLQIGAVIYLLYDVLDVAAFAGLSVILVSIFVNNTVAKRSSMAFSEVMKLKDCRMKTVKEAFGAIQVVKLNAWENKFLERINFWRLQEVYAVRKYLTIVATSTFLMWSTPLLVTITSFVMYAMLLGGELTAAKVFTSMVLFNSVRDPLCQFPAALQTLLQAHNALQRIVDFLDTKEIKQLDASSKDYHDDIDLAIEDATFSWGDPEARAPKFLLKDVSLSIRKGDFAVIHGPAGSGKTSLCLALLGELPAQQGKVFVRSRNIAYYSQQPWIQNMTIRDNILFGLPYDKTKYERVLDACGLVKDVAMFPAGDATEIGQKGVNLSGGQKARVSLARACYADADVYILDTPLAAVDAVVQSEIFNKCLCGLLESKTVVLVTHLHDIIESEAVNVKVLVEDGGVKVTYGDRKQSRRAYANLHTEAEDKEKAEEKDAIDAKIKVDDIGAFNVTENVEVGRVRRDVYRKYCLATGGWKIAIGYFASVCLWQSCQLGSDLWLSHWKAERSEQDASERASFEAYGGINAGRVLFEMMTKSLLYAPLRYFDTNPIGRVLTRYTEDVSVVDLRAAYYVSGVVISTAINAFQLLTAVYMIQWSSVLILPIAWAYMKVGRLYLATSRAVTRMLKLSKSPLLSHLAQSEEGVPVIRAFGQAQVDRAISEHFERSDTINRVWYAQVVVNQWFAMRIQLIGLGLVVIVITSLITLHSYLSSGLVGLTFMYIVNVDDRLSWWVKSLSWMENAMVSPERLMEYSDITPEGHASDKLIVTSPTNGNEWPQSGSITFEDVKFAYKPGGDLVLKGLSFCIQHNEKIGIVGRTGAGKSSLTMALFRINELVSGRILLDGVDISTINLQTLRSRMSIIPQVPVLFKGSMRAYMDPFEEYSDAEIWCAFEKMGLKEMIGGLDGKLAHELSENGENFSVGERQMLCLARALLRRSRVVVMDEATASIDRATEAKLQEMIMREFVDATVLTIAHRLSTVLESDRILVLSDGRVEEFDSATALVRVEGGVFRELAKESGYLEELLQ